MLGFVVESSNHPTCQLLYDFPLRCFEFSQMPVNRVQRHPDFFSDGRTSQTFALEKSHDGGFEFERDRFGCECSFLKAFNVFLNFHSTTSSMAVGRCFHNIGDRFCHERIGVEIHDSIDRGRLEFHDSGEEEYTESVASESSSDVG